MEVKGKYLWLDLETTGLDKEKCALLEAAVIVTDNALNELDCGECVIYRKSAHWETEAIAMHSKNGLIEKIKDPAIAIAETGHGSFERMIWDKLNKWFYDEATRSHKPAILAGASVHTDRQFLDFRQMTFLKSLSHKVFDTTTLMYFVRMSLGDAAFEKWSVKFPKEEIPHRAMEDLRRSLDFARHFRSEIILLSRGL